MKILLKSKLFYGMKDMVQARMKMGKCDNLNFFILPIRHSVKFNLSKKLNEENLWVYIEENRAINR